MKKVYVPENYCDIAYSTSLPYDRKRLLTNSKLAEKYLSYSTFNTSEIRDYLIIFLFIIAKKLLILFLSTIFF